MEYFARHYASAALPADDVRLCLYSICDNNSFLNSNRCVPLADDDHVKIRPPPGALAS